MNLSDLEKSKKEAFRKREAYFRSFSGEDWYEYLDDIHNLLWKYKGAAIKHFHPNFSDSEIERELKRIFLKV